VIAHLSLNDRDYSVDYSQGISVAIPLDPHGAQPSFFVDQPASATPLKSGDYIGDVNAGGSCNAEVIRFVPHCHGTHTECIGHLSSERITVQQTIYAGPCVVQVLSFQNPGGADANDMSMDVGLVMEMDWIQASLHPDAQALAIRSMPNPIDKMSRDYALDPEYPVFSLQAMQFLAAGNLKHLLLDTPSLDRANDGGKLSNHRTWWGIGNGLEHGSLDAAKRSVTEMIYIPESVKDGLYWMHLELSPLMSDATPSRPVIYPLTEKHQ